MIPPTSTSAALRTIRLVCLDVDGTLLDSKLQLRERVRWALHAAHRAGIAIAIATGRNLDSTRPILQELGLPVSVIACSGAHILTADGRPQELHLDSAEAHNLVMMALQAGSGLFLDRPECSWAVGNEEFVNRFTAISSNRYITDIAFAIRTPLMKISIINERATLDRLRQEISLHYPDLQVASPFFTVLDVTPAHANKGIALQTLGSMIGVPLEQVAALGDSENDLSIFRASGLSIAMANAPADVRSAADWVAPSNDEEGVTWAVRRILASNQRAPASSLEIRPVGP